MTVPAIAFPIMDPVAIEIGPVAIRWYALAYVAGIMAGWRMARLYAAAAPRPIGPEQVDDLVVWIVAGVLLGGRLGYVLFYKPLHYLTDPLAILTVWEGGMSFHGGLLGVVLAVMLFCRRRGIPVVRVGDMIAVVTPLGLLLGRLANFVNGELYGRPSDVPWAMVFPADPQGLPRHPSQLYEAGLEGLVLGLIMLFLAVRRGVRERAGLLTGVFLIGYGTARAIVELFRQPDDHLGFLLGGVTMGQLLSLPVIAVGIAFAVRSNRA